MRKRLLAIIATAAMVVTMIPAMAFAGEAVHKYVASDWTTAGGYGSVVEAEGSYVLKPSTGGEYYGYGYGPFAKAGLKTFSGDGTIVQEINILVDPASEESFVDNGYKFILASALNNVSGSSTAESSYGIQKSGDVVKVDGHDITMSEKDVYTFRIENRKAGNDYFAKLIVLKRGVKVGETAETQLTLNAGEPVGHRYLWVAGINVKDGIKVYKDVPDYTIALDKSELNLKKGEKAELTATVGPDFLENKIVGWESADEKIATVDQDGKVVAIAKGETTITAEFNGKEAVCKVVVTEVPEKSPNTGDDNMAPFAVAGLVMAAMAAVVATRRRYN